MAHWEGTEASAVAVEALPVTAPVTLPVTFPVMFPMNVPVVFPGRVGFVGIEIVHDPAVVMGEDPVTVNWLAVPTKPTLVTEPEPPVPQSPLVGLAKPAAFTCTQRAPDPDKLPTVRLPAMSKFPEESSVQFAEPPIALVPVPKAHWLVVMLMLPDGAAQVPSPRQNVELVAPVPLFRFVTGRFPVTPVVSGSPVKFVATPLVGVPRTGAVKMGAVSVLFVSVWLSVVPTMTPAGIAFPRVSVTTPMEALFVMSVPSPVTEVTPPPPPPPLPHESCWQGLVPPSLMRVCPAVEFVVGKQMGFGVMPRVSGPLSAV